MKGNEINGLDLILIRSMASKMPGIEIPNRGDRWIDFALLCDRVRLAGFKKKGVVKYLRRSRLFEYSSYRNCQYARLRVVKRENVKKKQEAEPVKRIYSPLSTRKKVIVEKNRIGEYSLREPLDPEYWVTLYRYVSLPWQCVNAALKLSIHNFGCNIHELAANMGVSVEVLLSLYYTLGQSFAKKHVGVLQVVTDGFVPDHLIYLVVEFHGDRIKLRDEVRKAISIVGSNHLLKRISKQPTPRVRERKEPSPEKTLHIKTYDSVHMIYNSNGEKRKG